jgi:chemotaxis family two-component system sensor kinase Cph1
MYVRHCLKGISNINTLIQDILSYSKIIGQKELPKDFLDLNSVAQEIKEDFGYRLAEINGHLKIINLPIIKAVRVQIHQLFLNLIGNSIKFRSEKPLLIEIFGLESDIFWEVRVRDNGIGIDKEYHNSVFEPFKRLNSKHTYEGSGVGLSICKRIVEGHGGTIMVQSNPTGGCEFVIKIPK